MAASGNSVAIKSFQSFVVNEGLLAKVVEAVKAGEKEARTSGDVKSFEVFYKGFRQNIAIGRIFIVPAKVCDARNTFPIALLFGTVVKELNLGEETADLITNKIGDSEFDEYSQADYQTIKDKFFMVDGKVTSLVIFAPHWSNIREYVAFKFTDDDEKLSNLLRHQVFASYFNPALSSAFEALMTTVDTTKLDITDITPKLSYPFLTENPFRAFPDLTKQGGWAKKKIFLTVKTADAVTMDVLAPEELNVFEALDTALTEATLPAVEEMGEVADYKGPDGSNHGNAEIPEINAITESIDNTKEAGADDGTGLRSHPDYGEKGSYTQEMNEENMKMGTMDAKQTHCKDCGQKLDGFKMCPDVSAKDAARGMGNCGKGWDKAAKGKKAEAPFEVPFTNVGPGTSAHDNANKAIAVKVDTISEKGEAPVGITLDDTGLPVRASLKKKAGEGAHAALGLLNQYFDSVDHPVALIHEALKVMGDENPEASHEINQGLTETDPAWASGHFDNARGMLMRAPKEEQQAAHVAAAISKNLMHEYDASSSTMKAAKVAREAQLNKYATRRKMADVPLTEESIWDDLMEDFGEAPQVELPGEGSSTSAPDASDGESEAVETTTTEEPKEEKKTEFKSKMFNKEKAEPKAEEKKEEPAEPKAEEPKEEKADEPTEKEASVKTGSWMNRGEVEDAMHRCANDPVLGPVTYFLYNFMEQVNDVSDGWHSWPLPARAASQLMDLIQSTGRMQYDPERPSQITVQQIVKAMAPIKAFMTRRGLKAGMVMPPLVLGGKKVAKGMKPHKYKGTNAAGDKVNECDTCGYTKSVCEGRNKKKADDVSGDFSEAKSEVVSPTTVDADIKQPVKSVEEAAKVGKTDVAGDPKYREMQRQKQQEQLRQQEEALSTKKADDVSGDIAEAKAEVESPSTVDADIKQPVKSVGEAAKVADDISGDVAEAKSELDAGAKAELADSPEATQTVNPEHFAADYGAVTRETIALAKRLIDIEDEIAIDVASNMGQMFGNIKHMKGFVNAVAEEIAGQEDVVAQHLEQAEVANDPFDAMRQENETFSNEDEHFAAVGDEHDEAVEMTLGFGDLADLATNLPHQDEHTASKTANFSFTEVADMAITAGVKVASYSSKNFKSKKDLKEAVARGEKISIYNPGMGEAPVNGPATLEGPWYPKPHTWYASVVMQDGIIVRVK